MTSWLAKSSLRSNLSWWVFLLLQPLWPSQHHKEVTYFLFWQQSADDVSQFDSKFTSQTPVDSPDDSALSESANQIFLVSDDFSTSRKWEDVCCFWSQLCFEKLSLMNHTVCRFIYTVAFCPYWLKKVHKMRPLTIFSNLYFFLRVWLDCFFLFICFLS